jgi:hypothetical protein
MVDSLIPKSLKGNKTVTTLISVAIIVVIIIIVYRIYKGLKATSNVVGNAVGNEIIATQLGMNTTRVVYIRSEAARLWEEGVTKKNWGILRDYDEEMFISTINEMATGTEVRLLDQFYKESAGERLKDAIQKSFNAGDRAKVNAQWLAVINS